MIINELRFNPKNNWQNPCLYQELCVVLLYEIERDTIDTSNDYPTSNPQSVQNEDITNRS